MSERPVYARRLELVAALLKDGNKRAAPAAYVYVAIALASAGLLLFALAACVALVPESAPAQVVLSFLSSESG